MCGNNAFLVNKICECLEPLGVDLAEIEQILQTTLDGFNGGSFSIDIGNWDEQPTGIELASTAVGCTYDANDELTGKVFLCKRGEDSDAGSVTFGMDWLGVSASQPVEYAPATHGAWRECEPADPIEQVTTQCENGDPALQTSGCNDDRRDKLLTEISELAAQIENNTDDVEDLLKQLIECCVKSADLLGNVDNNTDDLEDLIKQQIECCAKSVDILSTIEQHLRPIEHRRTASQVTNAMVGAGQYGYVGTLIGGGAGFDEGAGTYDGIRVPIGFTFAIDGDDNGGTIQNGATLVATGGAYWVVTGKA